MKPYNVEIFDRDMNFIISSLLNEDEFVYKFDAVTQVKNTVPVSKEFSPDLYDPRGWYIRISRWVDGKKEEYYGVINAIEKGEDFNIVTYSSLETIFDINIPVSTTALLHEYLETFMVNLIEDTFKYNSDASQNIPGLGFVGREYDWGIRTLPFCNTDEPVVSVNLLKDVINQAFILYGLYTKVTIESDMTIRVWIAEDGEAWKTIEGDLPNVTEAEYTIKKDDSQVNKVIIYDTYTTETYNYYLYTDGTISTSSSVSGKTRVTPVLTKVLITDKYSMAKNIVDEKYNGYLDTLTELAINSRNLTDDELSQLQTVCNVLMPMYRDYIGLPTYSFSKIYDSSEPGYGVLFTFSTTSGPSITSSTNSVIKAYSDGGDKFTHFGNNNKSIIDGYLYDEEYNFYGHAMFNVTVQVEGSYEIGESTISGTFTQYDYIPFGHDEGSKAVSEYKKTAAYITEIESNLNNAEILDQMEEWAKAECQKNKYNNNIVITCFKDDPMITPLSLNIGRVVNIIHNGVAYNSILTGKEISNSLVKLIFGTIRLDLTKILNMKGVR